MLGQHFFELLKIKINKITTVTPFKDVFLVHFFGMHLLGQVCADFPRVRVRGFVLLYLRPS